MPRKLQGIESPPPGPKVPAVQVQTLPTDDAGLVSFWRPQAAMRARKGESEFAIARFLHSKGVEGTAARIAAKEIMANPGNPSASGKIITSITGFLLFTVGLLVPMACIALDIGGFIGIAAWFASLIAVATGSRLLWMAKCSD